MVLAKHEHGFDVFLGPQVSMKDLKQMERVVERGCSSTNSQRAVQANPSLASVSIIAKLPAGDGHLVDGEARMANL